MLVFLAVGLAGAYRYVDNFWLYRGFAPPRDPAFVQVHGRQETFSIVSPALGGRSQQVGVYLPPAYDANAAQHNPVMYLLHGFPGRPLAFLETVRMGVWVDTLMAQRRIGGVILVMPFGSTGTFEDKEWANGIRRGQGWESFVAHDVVQAVDAHYRTIPAGAARAIAGRSEGGYGEVRRAIDCGLRDRETRRRWRSGSRASGQQDRGCRRRGGAASDQRAGQGSTRISSDCLGPPTRLERRLMGPGGVSGL